MSILADAEVLETWRETQRETRLARPRPGAIGKVRPGTIRLPSELRAEPRETPWWKAAPALVHVCVATGRVWVWRLWAI